jgi:hypothetical protein
LLLDVVPLERLKLRVVVVPEVTEADEDLAVYPLADAVTV